MKLSKESQPLISRRSAFRIGAGVSAMSALKALGCSSGENPTPDATQPGGSVNTPTPTEVATATPTPTETSTPETPEGSRGNVASVEQLNIPDAQKEAINKMLEGATTQVMVQDEETGQVVIIAIDNDMINANPRMCPDTIGSNTMSECSSAESITLADGSKAGSLVNGVLMGKWLAWKSQTNSSMSFEDFVNSKEQGTFLQRTKNIFSGEGNNNPVDKYSPFVFILSNQPGERTVEYNTAFSSEPLYGNGVIGDRYYTKNGVGTGAPKGIPYIPGWEFAGRLTHSIVHWVDEGNLNVVGNGLRTNPTVPQAETNQILANFRDDTSSIFVVEGKYIPPPSQQ